MSHNTSMQNLNRIHFTIMWFLATRIMQFYFKIDALRGIKG